MCIYTTSKYLMFWKLRENYEPSKTLDNFFELWFCSAQTPFFGSSLLRVCVGGILKVILFVTILCLFYVLIFWPPGLWNLSSLAKDKTSTPLLWKAKSQPLDH